MCFVLKGNSFSQKIIKLTKQSKSSLWARLGMIKIQYINEFIPPFSGRNLFPHSLGGGQWKGGGGGGAGREGWGADGNMTTIVESP